MYVQLALSIPPHFPPSLVFLISELFSPLVLSCFVSPDLSSHCFSSILFFSACLILPSLARHRGCKSAQQLLSWHALHCLLTVLFLLDFIKTPSAVSSGMVDGVVEEEVEKGRQWEKSERFGDRMVGEWLNSRGECRLPQWSPVGGTPAAYDSRQKLNLIVGASNMSRFTTLGMRGCSSWNLIFNHNYAKLVCVF